MKIKVNNKNESELIGFDAKYFSSRVKELRGFSYYAQTFLTFEAN